MISPEVRAHMLPKTNARIAGAPGRLDVMGGIADYSGSLVLQMPLDRQTTAVLQPRNDPAIEIVSLRGGTPFHLNVQLGALLDGDLDTPAKLVAYFAANESERWGAYILGVVHACLVRRPPARGVPTNGFRLVIESRVPEGKGISSSAALEVACLGVISAHYGRAMLSEEIAEACQWAENHIAGAPCGIMDQMASACGREGRLLRLRCQPATIEGHVLIPDSYRFYGIDSGIRHAVTGAGYGTVRTAAFMGYRMIADVAGFPVQRDDDGVRVHDDKWHGYLANIPPAYFVEHFDHRLPDRMSGSEFLGRYHGITDSVSRVQPNGSYNVRQATRHPIFENARVERFADLLAALEREPANAIEMGKLMYDSHASYSACGLGSDGTDRLVTLAAEVGADVGVFGAKITGAGSGGTVAIFATVDAAAQVRAIAARYSAETGHLAEVFADSGPGMAEQGISLSF